MPTSGGAMDPVRSAQLHRERQERQRKAKRDDRVAAHLERRRI